MANTFWEKDFLIMCSYMSQSADCFMHSGFLLHIISNYAFQTSATGCSKGYTASKYPPTRACILCRSSPICVSYGAFPGSTIKTFKFVSPFLFVILSGCAILGRDEQNRRQEQPANTVNGNQKSFGHLKGAKTIAR